MNENTGTGQNCNTKLRGLSGPMRLSNIFFALYLKVFIIYRMRLSLSRLTCSSPLGDALRRDERQGASDELPSSFVLRPSDYRSLHRMVYAITVAALFSFVRCLSSIIRELWLAYPKGLSVGQVARLVSAVYLSHKSSPGSHGSGWDSISGWSYTDLYPPPIFRASHKQ